MKAIASIALLGLVAASEENELFEASRLRPSQGFSHNDGHIPSRQALGIERQPKSSEKDKKKANNSIQVPYHIKNPSTFKVMENDDNEYFATEKNQTEKKPSKGFFGKIGSLVKSKLTKKDTNNLDDMANDHELSFQNVFSQLADAQKQNTLKIIAESAKNKQLNQEFVTKLLQHVAQHDDEAGDNEFLFKNSLVSTSERQGNIYQILTDATKDKQLNPNFVNKMLNQIHDNSLFQLQELIEGS